MAEVSSTRTLSLGSPAPDFALHDAEGRLVTLPLVRGSRGLVVAFVCNHCPFVIHLAKEMGAMAEECRAAGIGFVAINPNDSQRYPADAPAKMLEFARQSGWRFPYLVDSTQEVAQAYFAACTPDFYLFDQDLCLTYCGQFDDSRPGNRKPVTGHDLRRAVAALVAGEAAVPVQRPSTGCSIKWKPGHEPAWFSK